MGEIRNEVHKPYFRKNDKPLKDTVPCKCTKNPL